MLSSARRLISYPNPDRSDRPDIPAHIGNLIPFLDADVIFNQGSDAARIVAAHQSGGGRFWWTTDTLVMWYDNGTTWFQVGLTLPQIQGYQLDYAQFTATSGSIPGGGSEAAAVTIVPGNSVTYDGTRVFVEGFVPETTWTSGNLSLKLVLFRDSTAIGQSFASTLWPATAQMISSKIEGFDTPSAGLHTYSLRAFNPGSNSANVVAGPGTPGNLLPAYLRVTKA